MKTFDEFIQEESYDLNESRLLRKGGAFLLARSAKKHGDDATRSLNDAKRKMKGSSLDSDEQRLRVCRTVFKTSVMDLSQCENKTVQSQES